MMRLQVPQQASIRYPSAIWSRKDQPSRAE